MRMLIISGTIPPDSSATADILRKIIPYIQKSGWQVDCLTVKEKLKDPEITLYQSMTIYHANYLLYLPKENPSLVEKTIFKWRRIKNINHDGHIPLYKEEMVTAFLKELKKCHAENYDALVAVCAYYAAAEAVRRFVSKYAYKGKTILYQVDPLTNNVIYSPSLQDAREAYEKKIHNTWTAVLSTPIIKRYWEEKGKNSENLFAVEFPVIQRPVVKEVFKKKDEEIRCVFAGFLYPELRNPKYVLDLFSKIDNPNVHLYIIGTGMERMLYEYKENQLKTRLHLIGRVSGEECNSWLASADILVNIGNAASNQVPSKIFQYLSFGKPILNIYKQADCPSLPYLTDYPLALNILERGQAESVEARKLESWINDMRNKELPFEWIYNRYYECTPERVSKVLLDCLR